MIAHSQFCDAGDNTLGAIAHAVDRVLALGLGAHANSSGSDGHSERVVIVVTDANFARFLTHPNDTSSNPHDTSS